MKLLALVLVPVTSPLVASPPSLLVVLALVELPLSRMLPPVPVPVPPAAAPPMALVSPTLPPKPPAPPVASLRAV